MREREPSAFDHLVRAAQELALAVAAGAGAVAQLRDALRAEEKRWAERAARDPAAERVREIFAALADVLEPNAHSGFDRPRTRWDTRDRWRS